MSQDNDGKLIAVHQRMGETLVAVGLASKVVFNEAKKTGDALLTNDGVVFKRQLLKMYDHLAKDKGKEGTTRFLEVLTFLVTQR